MSRPRTVAYKVFKFLKEVKVASVQDISYNLGINSKNVYSALSTLVKSGHVEKLDGGLYRIKKYVW